MHRQRLDELITAKLTGTLGPKGRQELQSLLREHPELVQELLLLEQFWAAVPEKGAALPVADRFEEMMDQALTPAVRRSYPWKWGVAALLAGLLIGVGFMMQPQRRATTTEQKVLTRNGERRHFRLPDGTTVHLNAGSRLTCASGYGSKNRDITLSGEAYFDVAPNPALPFRVHAGSLHVQALGTAFNVKAYPEDAILEATLLQGAVEVYEDARPDKKIRLRPYEKYSLQVKTDINKINAPVPPPIATLPAADTLLRETAWISNRLQFDAMRFEELAVLLERWYGVHIRFNNDHVKNYTFSGIFTEETISQALSALQLTEPFRFDVQGNNITIY